MLKPYLDRHELPTHDLFAALVDNSSAHVFAKDVQLRYLYLNQAAAKATGRTVEEILGQDDFFIFPLDVATRLHEVEMALLADGKAITIRQAIQLNGRTEHFSTTKNAIFNSAGAVIGLVGISHDITDLHVSADQYRENAERDKRLHQELLEANKLKENFFGILGHELRNPLNALSNCVVLMTETNDAETHFTMLQVMVRQVAQLKRLTNDLLDVNRMANGKLVIEKTHIDLADVLSAAVESSRSMIEKSGQKLIVRYFYSPITVDGDFARLMQLITNLLNNAAKFSTVGGQIQLSMERAGKYAVIRVKDNGIGIKQDMLGKIFDLYTQVNQSDSGPQGGLGLGLALVKYIASRHGGTVNALSDGPGKGSEFVVQLPIVDELPGGSNVV